MELNAHTLTLAPAMVKNGYVAFPMSAKNMFPSDSLGSWSPEGMGATVELRFGPHRRMSDVCIKSTKSLAFRARMSGWLQGELRARAGDRLRVERLAERIYQIVPLSS